MKKIIAILLLITASAVQAIDPELKRIIDSLPDKTMDGMYYCQELSKVGIVEKTGDISKYKGNYFRIKLKNGVLELKGDDTFFPLRVSSDPTAKGNLVIVPKKNWIYANGYFNFSEFRLSNGSFVLIENDTNEFQLSTGTCEKW